MNEIHSSFKHGDGLKIGKFCVIDEDVQVGNNVTIENFVLLKKGTRIGHNVFVDSYVRSSGHNVIGDNVILRYGCTIAKGVIVDNYVFISPNVMTIYSNHKGEEIEGTFIGHHCHIGTAAVIGPGVNIVPHSVVGAMAYVSRSIDVPGIYTGIPARRKGNA